MPFHLRVFFWLIVAISAYWVAAMVWAIAFPPFAPAAMIAVSTALRVLVFLGLAWSAAWRRRNWARWLLLMIFFLMLAGPLGAGAHLHQPPQLLARYSDPRSALVMAALAVAMIFAFTGDARDAFGRARAA